MRMQSLVVALSTLAVCHAAPDPNQLYRDALTAYDQGRYANAERLHEQALPLHKAVLPASHELITTALHNLGVLARIRGDYDTASKRLNEALALAPRGSVRRADTLNALASVYTARKRPLDAEPLVREAIAILESAPQPDALELADALNSLGMLHLVLDDAEGAERQLRKAQQKVTSFPDAPPEFHVTLSINLATSIFRQNRVDEAINLYDEALHYAVELLGAEHPRTAMARDYYAEALKKSGRKKAARDLIRTFAAH